MSADGSRTLHCPKCQAPMETVTFEETRVDRCTGCRGIWFDVDEHARLMTRKGSEELDSGDALAGQKLDAIRDIDCPLCNLRMVHRVARKAREIQYEQCSGCMGAFFDAGEFTELKHEKGFVEILLDVFSVVRSR